MKRAEIIYTYRGRVERGPRYQWRDGFSETTPEGHVVYPWMTMRECQRDAKARGGIARFRRNEGGGEVKMTTENLDRAIRARRCVDLYARQARQRHEDARTNAVDLIADLMHLAAARGWEWEGMLVMAEIHFEEEKSEEGATDEY